MGNDLRALYDEAKIALDKNDLYKVSNIINNLDQLKDISKELSLIKVKYLFQSHRVLEALGEVNKAVELFPKSSGAFYERGRIYESLGSKENSYKDFKKAYELDKEDENIRTALGRVAFNMKYYEEARELFREIYHCNKSDEISGYFSSSNSFLIKELEGKGMLSDEEKASLGESYFFMGKIEEAKASFDEIEVLNKVEYLLTYTYILKNLSQINKVMPYIEKAIKLEPENPRTYLYKGIFLQEMNNTNEAIEFYKKCIDLNENYKPVYNRIIDALNGLGKYSDALTYKDKAESFNYDKEITFNNIGESYYYLNKYDKAVEYFDKSIGVCDNYAKPLINKSRILRQKERYRDAMDLCNKVVDFGYNGELIAVEKALILRSVQEYNGALEWLDWFIDSTEEDCTLSKFVKSIVLSYMDNNLDALDIINEVINTTNNDVIAYAGKIFIKFNMECYDECINICKEYTLLKNTNKAIESFRDNIVKSKSRLKYDDIYNNVIEILNKLATL